MTTCNKIELRLLDAARRYRAADCVREFVEEGLPARMGSDAHGDHLETVTPAPTGRRRRRPHAIGRTSRSDLPSTLIPTLKPGSPAEVLRRPGRTKRAEFIDNDVLGDVAALVQATSKCPESDMAKLMASHKAGLRAGEIAKLTIRNVTDLNGEIGKYIFVGSGISKSRNDRQIPTHPELREALEALIDRFPHATHIAFSVGAGGRLRYQSPRSVAMWFKRLYDAAGLKRCSSHSGRRSFATKIARRLDGSEASLADLQKLMGHAHLSSTQCYLEAGQNVVDLVSAI